MARNKAKRKAPPIANKDIEVLDLKCEDVSMDDEPRSMEDVDVKPDVTILEQTTRKNTKGENHHVAIISTENQPVVFEKVKAETSYNHDSDNTGSSDDYESENLGAVLTNEEVTSSKEQEWEPDSSDSSSAEEDENHSDSDASWTDGKSKTQKIRRQTEAVKEPTATKSTGKMKHKKSTGKYKGFICHYCEKRFQSVRDLKRHRVSRHERKKCPHKCPLCKFDSAYRHGLTKHLKTIHQLVKTKEGDYIEVPQETALPEKKHTCDICGYKARWNAHLVRHKRTKHSEAKTFKCTFPGCDRSYKLEDHLRRHAKHHLLQTKEFAENAEDPWWRGLASEVPELIVCVNAYNLSVHMKKHAKEPQRQRKRHECPECSKACASAYHLSSHMKPHSKKKEKEPKVKHQCPECSKVCSTAFNLSSHMKTHLKKQQKGPEGHLRKSRRKQIEMKDSEEIDDAVVIKVEEEINSEDLQNDPLPMDTATMTQVVQASVSNTCALLKEMVAYS